MKRILLIGVASAAVLAGTTAVTAPAMAGTYSQGSWNLDAPGGTTYTAQVQQPVNFDGSSVFSAKNRTIPVKYKVTAQSKFAFESVVNGTGGDSGVTPGDHTDWSYLGYTVPSGTTVKDITNLTANFNWTYGENHGGGFRWQIGTPSGNIMVDYGDASNSLQGDTAGSGVNMVNSALASQQRDESSQVGGTMYTSWQYVLDHFGDLQVNSVALIVDGGWGAGPGGTHDQVLDLSTVTVGLTSGSSTFTWPAATAGQTDNSQPAWISLSKMSGNTPLPPIDEQLITSTQGDSGGQFRQIDSMYMYNLPVSNLPDKAATYQVGISFHPDGSGPVGVVKFGLK
jgi:hypothetical protein